MRTKTLNKAKLMVKVEGNKSKGTIKTISVYNLRTGNYWSRDRILERGITWFLNMKEMKETLNWNLNGDSSKYQFKWVYTVRDKSEGIAYIFD